MNIYYRLAGLLLLMVLSGFWQVTYAEEKAEQKAADTNKSLSIDNFTKLPGVRDLQISPDGKHLSVVFKKNNEDMLGILETATMKPTGFFSVKGDGKGVGTVSWVNNKRLVYTVTESYIWDKQVFENGELAGVDVDGRNHKVIFGYRAGYSTKRNRIKRKKSDYGNHDIIDLLPDDENNILLAFYPWKLIGKTYKPNRTAHPIIYKLNIDSGRKRKVDILPIPQSRAISDNQGNVRFAVGIDDDNEQLISYKAKADDDWQESSFKFEGSGVYPLSFSQDNQGVYFVANVGDGTRGLFLYDLKAKSAKKLVHNPKVDISNLLWDFSKRRIIGVGTDLGLPDYQYIDAKDAKTLLHQNLRVTFKDKDVVITSASKDTTKTVVYVYSDTDPGSYYLFDSKKVELRWLISKRQWIDPKLMAKTQSVIVKTRDDATIRGYLTLPKGKDKGLPMVVLPHGGPHGIRDFWGFDWEVQLLASRGYAVLQMNYRGSGGFGEAFEEAGKGNWGTLMQDDLTDATKAMIDTGVADAKRICLYGTSYGGYAALMGAVKEPELYRCVIGSAGVYNLPMMFKLGDIAQRSSGLAYLKEVLGENSEDLKSRSPVFNVKKIKAQVMLIHGAQDERAPIEQAKSLMSAMDEIGKSYQFIEMDDEAHGYYDESNRLSVYKAVLDFLDKHIGG